MEKYEQMGPGSSGGAGSLRLFTGLVLVAQVLGLGVVILVAVWLGHYRGGFAWQSDPSKEFNYHPLFMVIGFVFLSGNAMLVYRVFRNDKKIYVKMMHAMLQLSALVFVAIGLKAVFDSHNLPTPPINNLYSLHSWLGIATVALFCLQWLGGCISFLKPGLSTERRTSYKPHHVFWGVLLYILAIATCLTGLTEKAFFSVQGYSSFVPEGYLVNAIGLLLVALGAVVVYVVTKPDYAREPLPEEQHIRMTEDLN